MNSWVYFTGTLVLYFLCLMGGLFIKNLGVVFEIIAALTMSNINFICPGYFFLLACRRFIKEEGQDSFFKHKVISLVQIFLGLSMFILVVYTIAKENF